MTPFTKEYLTQEDTSPTRGYLPCGRHGNCVLTNKVYSFIHSGLMVSTLDCGLSDPGSSAGRGNILMSYTVMQTGVENINHKNYFLLFRKLYIFFTVV